MDDNQNTINVLLMRYRNFVIPILIGCLTGTSCTLAMLRYQDGGAADFGGALRSAQDLLNGLAPYRFIPDYAPYLLNAAFVAIPFLFLMLHVAAGLFYGLSSTLLAWCLLRYGKNWSLLLFVKRL